MPSRNASTLTKPWPTVRLGEVLRRVARPVEVAAEQTYREIGIRSHGKGLFHKQPITGLELGNKRVFWLEPGDFVLNIVFAWEGAVALIGPDEAGMIGSHRFPTFRADETRLDLRFLVAYFKTPSGLDQLGRVSPGGAGRNRTLSQTGFLNLPIPLPPAAEQRRVMARIEELAAQIHEARTLRHQAAEETEALLASFRRAAFGEASQPDWIPLSDYVEGIVNGKSPATEGRRAASDEWAVLKVGAVSFGVFDDQENKALPVSYAVPPSMEVRAGDVIMSRANTVELVGACALVRKTRPKLMLSDKTFRFVFREPRKVLPEYMEQVLKSPPLREQIERCASGTSPTMKNISKEKVLALRLPPFELPEQRRIVAELDALQAEMDALKRLQAETTAELDALLPALLDRAFKGELVLPESVELKLELQVIEAPVARRRPNRRFARALLSAEIVHRLHAEPTFGRVKHQKIFHLCEHIAQLGEIAGQYHREAAGPLDNQLIYTNEQELKKQQWFAEVPRQPFGHAYRPLPKAGAHRRYVEEYWPDKLALIERLIERMRGWDTERCEIFSTLYAAWNDLLIWGHAATDDAILREVLERWHESKRRIPEERWLKAIAWIRKEGFTPTGFGKPTCKPG